MPQNQSKWDSLVDQRWEHRENAECRRARTWVNKREHSEFWKSFRLRARESTWAGEANQFPTNNQLHCVFTHCSIISCSTRHTTSALVLGPCSHTSLSPARHGYAMLCSALSKSVAYSWYRHFISHCFVLIFGFTLLLQISPSYGSKHMTGNGVKTCWLGWKLYAARERRQTREFRVRNRIDSHRAGWIQRKRMSKLVSYI